VQQPEEPAAEAEAERIARLRLEVEAGVVDHQLVERLAQLLEVLSIRRVKPAEHHPLRFFVTFERLSRVIAGNGDRIADLHVAERLDIADEVTHLPGAELIGRLPLRSEMAQFDHFMRGSLLNKLDLLAPFHRAVHDPHVGDGAAKLVVVGVEDHRLQRGAGIAARRGDALDYRLQDPLAAESRFAAAAQHFVGFEPERLDHFLADLIGARVVEVDFVHRRDDGQVVLHRGERVGDRLGFDPLEGVDQQHSAFAAGERAGNFVMKVDVPWRIDQVQFVLLPLVGVVHRDGAGLDRDAALPLDRHVVEQLLLRFTLAHRAGDLHQPIGKRALAVIDVSDDRKIANELRSCHVTFKKRMGRG
jgi:hypothetical protein